MAKKRWFSTLVLYSVLELGALFGVPIRPDEIEAMTRQMLGARESVEQVQTQDDE